MITCLFLIEFHSLDWLALDILAGEAVMMWSSKERQYPLLALAFNHRAEAFYRAD